MLGHIIQTGHLTIGKEVIWFILSLKQIDQNIIWCVKAKAFPFFFLFTLFYQTRPDQSRTECDGGVSLMAYTPPGAME